MGERVKAINDLKNALKKQSPPIEPAQAGKRQGKSAEVESGR